MLKDILNLPPSRHLCKLQGLNSPLTPCLRIGASHKHSAYSSTFPIYLFERWEEEVPEEVPAPTSSEEEETTESTAIPEVDSDEDEALVEDVTKDEETKVELPSQKMVNVTKEQWSRLNSQQPLWAR